MRIAFSTEGKKGLESLMCHHFGRCPHYVLINIEDSYITEIKAIDNPFYQKQKHGMMPKFIKEQGVEVMITVGMGQKAIELFSQFGIQVATGAIGTARMALNLYLDGKLESAISCKESVENGH